MPVMMYLSMYVGSLLQAALNTRSVHCKPIVEELVALGGERAVVIVVLMTLRSL